MKIQLLLAAVRSLQNEAETQEQWEEMQDAIEELQASKEAIDKRVAKDNDCYWYDVSVVPDLTMTDLLNETTYDVYGRAARNNGNELSFEGYKEAFNTSCSPNDVFSDRQLMLGYDLINDLWHDNDSLGENNADGSFNVYPQRVLGDYAPYAIEVLENMRTALSEEVDEEGNRPIPELTIKVGKLPYTLPLVLIDNIGTLDEALAAMAQDLIDGAL